MKTRTYIAAALLLGLVSASPVAEAESGLDVKVVPNSETIPRYEVLELTFRHDGHYEDPFFDVTIRVVFHAPSGRSIEVGGFHYGSSEPTTASLEKDERDRPRPRYTMGPGNLWKARLAPREVGTWRYDYAFTDIQGGSAAGTGSFSCVEGRVAGRGFLRPNPRNPFRWVYEDGSPAFLIGLQECVGDNTGTGSVLDGASLEGPFRTDRTDLVELPEGPLYVRGPSGNPQNADVYFRRYGRSGFNLFRFSQQNCSLAIYDDLDHYRVQEAAMVDDLLRYARKYGFSVMYGFFGYQKAYTEDPANAEGMAKVRRFVKYSVDRWGAYVDIWEFLNEQKAEAAWYAQMVPYLKSIDPYGHPVTTSWEHPEIEGIDINAPHWYMNEDELTSDTQTAQRAGKWKAYGKPVIVGEQGNWVDRKKPRPPGVGGVWDAGSALRMRIRNWTALFKEIVFVFWNTSYARDGHYMNIWLGPQERQYVRAMQDFASRLDSDVKPVDVAISDTQSVRAYGLASDRRAGVYLHHFSDHATPVAGLKLGVEVPASARGYWYSPEDGNILATFEPAAGRQTLQVPEFAIDLALLVTPEGAPDIDRDGIPNDADLDDDNDGVADTVDAFPLGPEEWEDKDGDLIGDNLDADDDGDGVGDDADGNGTPDHEELDYDGDGVPRAKAVPWDAFPDDPSEWRDTDGDGIGDNADTDDDGDGWSDAEEKTLGTDPLNRLSFPTVAGMER